MASGLASALRAEIGKIIAPLSAAAAVPFGPATLLRAIGHLESLGLDPGLRTELERITALAREFTELPDAELESWAATARVLTLARALMSALQAAPAAVDDPALAARAHELGVELSEILLAQYLRSHYPHLFRGAAALTLVSPAERADAEPMVLESQAVARLPWARDRLHVDRLALLVQDALGTLRSAYLPGEMRLPEHAHLAAAQLFPLLGDLATSMDLGWFIDQSRVAPEVPSPTPVEDEGGGGEEWPPADDPDQGPVPHDHDLTAFRRDFLPRFGVWLPRDLDDGPQAPRFGVSVVASSAQHPGSAAGFILRTAGELDWSELRGKWRVTAATEGAVPAFSVGPGGVRIVPGEPEQVRGLVTLTAEGVDADDGPVFVLGAVDGTRVEIGAIRFVVGAELSTDRSAVWLSADAGSAAVVLTAEPGDGFLQTVLPDGGVRVPFDLGVGLSSDRGLELRGGAGLAVTLAVRLTLGPVSVHQVRLRVSTDGRATDISLDSTLLVHLGPVDVAVEGLGMRLGASATPGGGSLGPLDVDAGFRWPSGAGLAVAAGPVSGGGFVAYDEEAGTYSGALTIRLQRIGVRAVARLDTRLPGGRSGFSLLVMLSARFSPGISLPFGIVLTGVGGLIGVNRRIDVDALRRRYADGTAGLLLVAEDPVRDLPALLTGLSEIFPPADGVYVVGPTLQLQWVKIVTLDVGVFLEFPGPTRAVVLGTARASIENPLADGPLLRLRCDFVGVLDLVHSTFAFDAVLVESRLLERFPVTGGLLFRASWGAEPYALLSVGGFHPDFAPGSLAVPKTLTRLAMSSGSPDDKLFLRFEGYFAITSNTVQFGASVEVNARLSGSIRVRGFIEFHALIRFEPFFFTTSFRTGMQVQWRGRTFAGLTVSGTLSGPGPVRFRGKVCIELFFFDVCAGPVDLELGSDAPPAVSAAPRALSVIAKELRDPQNLRAASQDRTVALRALPPSTPPVLPPTGLIWEQTRAPLGLLLERLEGVPLRRAETIEVSGDDVSGEERDWFAPGGFSELTDSEAVTRRSFERLVSGVRLAAGPDVVSTGLLHEVTVREFRVPAPEPVSLRRPPLEAPHWLVEAGQVRERRSDGRRAAPAIEVRPERWHVLDAAGQRLVTAGEAQAHQLARARGAVALPADDLLTMTDL